MDMVQNSNNTTENQIRIKSDFHSNSQSPVPSRRSTLSCKSYVLYMDEHLYTAPFVDTNSSITYNASIFHTACKSYYFKPCSFNQTDYTAFLIIPCFF